MVLCRLLAAAFMGLALFAQPSVMPLNEIRPGMRGIGKTVFSGDRVDQFDVEVLGVLENVGPKQSLVLARLSGGPLQHTGVLQGMSGSPVYIGGRLVGAVAMSFPYAKDPIAAIRPFEEMTRERFRGRDAQRAGISLWETDLTRNIARSTDVPAGESRLMDIATPVSFAGFTRGTIEHFGAQLKSLGFEPTQGVAGGGKPAARLGNPTELEPGSMISVQLLTGDMSVGADGTVTAVEGKHVYAFGHRFLSIGDTQLPFARAEVLTLLPNLSSSFKISTAREWMGTITADYNTAVAGELGRRASMIPVSVEVQRKSSSGKPISSAGYRMEMVNDRYLSPFLLQMAVFSAIDATERTVGVSSFLLRGHVEFENAAPLKLDNAYAGEFNVPAQVSLGAAMPVAYALQSGFDALTLKNVSITVEAFSQNKQLQVAGAWASREVVRPGESVDLTVLLAGENGVELSRTVSYQVPVGAVSGPLFFTAADGNTTNLTEYRHVIGEQPKSPSRVLSFLNGLRGNNKAYVRVWRASPGYQIEGEDLPNPPASVSMVLGHGPANQAGWAVPRNAKVAEMAIDTGGMIVTGSKTVQVEIKE